MSKPMLEQNRIEEDEMGDLLEAPRPHEINHGYFRVWCLGFRPVFEAPRLSDRHTITSAE